MNTTENCDIHNNNECDCIGKCKYNSNTTTEDTVNKKVIVNDILWIIKDYNEIEYYLGNVTAAQFKEDIQELIKKQVDKEPIRQALEALKKLI